MTDYTSVINALYKAIQFRPAPAADVATYNAALNSGVTVTAVTNLIELDPYTIDYVNPVIREYQAAFGRVPDQAGLGYWVGQVASSPNALAELSVIFANSAEFNSRYGASATSLASVALVGLLYENVLGRPPDAAGLAYWSSQNLDAAQLLQAFAQSAEFITDTAAAITIFENGEAAVTPTNPTTGSLLDLIPASGQIIALTTGVDTPSLTANGNTINGTFNGAGADLDARRHAQWRDDHRQCAQSRRPRHEHDDRGQSGDLAERGHDQRHSDRQHTVGRGGHRQYRVEPGGLHRPHPVERHRSEQWRGQHDHGGGHDQYQRDRPKPGGRRIVGAGRAERHRRHHRNRQRLGRRRPPSAARRPRRRER